MWITVYVYHLWPWLVCVTEIVFSERCDLSMRRVEHWMSTMGDFTCSILTFKRCRLLGRDTILTSRELTSCETAHTHIVMSRYLMWAFGARQSGEITLQSYRFQCSRRHKQCVVCKQLTDNIRRALDTVTSSRLKKCVRQQKCEKRAGTWDHVT